MVRLYEYRKYLRQEERERRQGIKSNKYIKRN
jgi:hypothetical protein